MIPRTSLARALVLLLASALFAPSTEGRGATVALDRPDGRGGSLWVLDETGELSRTRVMELDVLCQNLRTNTGLELFVVVDRPARGPAAALASALVERWAPADGESSDRLVLVGIPETGDRALAVTPSLDPGFDLPVRQSLLEPVMADPGAWFVATTAAISAHGVAVSAGPDAALRSREQLLAKPARTSILGDPVGGASIDPVPPAAPSEGREYPWAGPFRRRTWPVPSPAAIAWVLAVLALGSLVIGVDRPGGVEGSFGAQVAGLLAVASAGMSVYDPLSGRVPLGLVQILPAMIPVLIGFMAWPFTGVLPRPPPALPGGVLRALALVLGLGFLGHGLSGEFADAGIWTTGGVIFVAVLVLFGRWTARRLPPRCPVCQGRTRRLSEREEDRYLSEGQQREEELGTVDYDVWICPDHDHPQIRRWAGSWKGLHRSCPACGFMTLAVEERILTPATRRRGPRIKQTRTCIHCRHREAEVTATPAGSA